MISINTWLSMKDLKTSNANVEKNLGSEMDK
jgi:hypothetical protein